MQKRNFRNRFLITVLFGTFVLYTGIITADAKIEDLSIPKTYDGVATSLSTVDIYGGFDNEFKGIITYTPLAGTLFKGPILDANGKTKTRGDILVQMSTEYRDAQVKQAEAAVEKDKAALDSVKALYERYRKIHEAEKGAISEQVYLEGKNSYLQALAQLEADNAALILAQKLRSICTYYARFDGVVDEVYFPSGYVGNFGVSTLKVSQLVPIAINVKMSREEAFAVNVYTPISVYPLGSSTPVGVFRGDGRITEDGLQFIVPNYINTPDTKKLNSGKEVPVINKITVVAPFNPKNFIDNLGINKQCLGKDEKGYFVYKVKGQKTADPGVGLNPELNIEKVYVTLGNEISPIEPSVELISLKDEQSLDAYDIVLYASEFDKIKGNDTVYYIKERYLFMPGDPAKVVIGGPSK